MSEGEILETGDIWQPCEIGKLIVIQRALEHAVLLEKGGLVGDITASGYVLTFFPRFRKSSLLESCLRSAEKLYRRHFLPEETNVDTQA